MKTNLPYPPGLLVKVTKLSRCENPLVEPASWDDWRPGSPDNNGSLPVDYELRGVLLEEVRVGGQIIVFRTQRNGVEAEGLFESTNIRRIEDNARVVTLNSVYSIQPLGKRARSPIFMRLKL